MTTHRRPLTAALCIFGIALLAPPRGACRAEDDVVDQARAAMRRAATFYREQAASHGGYVYYYSPDLKRRWGEGVAEADQIWVQPPGTPTVGLAFLQAYAATGDRYYLEGATAAAEALVYGQLASGGWTNCVDFNPRGKRVAEYRNGRGRGRNFSTLDDGISQGAIRLLMRVDQVLEQKNRAIHEAVEFALDSLLKAQFPNGGFPQGWRAAVEPHPSVRGNYPAYDWRTEGRIKNYWDLYTLNDGLAGTVSDTLIDAANIYGDANYKAALAKLGDFLLLAQMPDPQPAWAQQYNYQMQPVWARKFEPPAITGGESQDALQTLLKIYRVTGDKKYLAPFPSALRYLKASLLPDGQLARYYELQTNKPLYMRRRGDVYTLTHDDSDLPRHYGWKIESRLEAIEAQYNALAQSGPSAAAKPDVRKLEREARRIIDKLDAQGRWMSLATGERLVGQPKFAPNTPYIASELFSRNLETLSAYLQAMR